MTDAAGQEAPQVMSLIREDEEQVHDFPFLVSAHHRIVAGLRLLLGEFGCADTTIRLRETTPAAGEAHPPRSVTAWFTLPPLRGHIALAIPASLVIRLVDFYFGGNGEVETGRYPLTAAEERFATRFAEAFAPVLSNAFATVGGQDAALARMEFGREAEPRAPEPAALWAQGFDVEMPRIGRETTQLSYHVASLNVMAPRDADQTAATVLSASDRAWLAKMRESVMEAHLPVRTIFVRPELPLARLMALQPDDIIPITLPRRIPVTVGGRLFAQATLGESNGRAAIRIEQIEQGTARS